MGFTEGGCQWIFLLKTEFTEEKGEGGSHQSGRDLEREQTEGARDRETGRQREREKQTDRERDTHR